MSSPQDSVKKTTADLLEAIACAVVRLPDASAADRVADALLAGGVRAIEITLTTEGALDAIEQLARRDDPGLIVGVGSARTRDDARRAIDAGAAFVVSPITVPEVIEASHERGTPALPGAYTPTEIHTATQLGAPIVKVFPADSLGPKYIKGVRAPMPELKLMPTGGVTPENAGEWLAAGAAAVGVGSALVSGKAVADGDFESITRAARTLADSCGLP